MDEVNLILVSTTNIKHKAILSTIYSSGLNKDNNKNKLMTLDALEFIRRFLLHIFPQRFIKIRYYGILSNKNRNLKLARCRKIFGVMIKKKKDKLNTAKLFKMLIEIP
ncbi:transposase [Fonticella tunisiensis]|uniref:transposase n=1 Tax=Fonticella tunisiensis TaxID=1096341 RepID=UPI001A9C03DA|nr:transposase [Fonticella tunisiensis]